jgi:hypothetical protein
MAINEAHLMELQSLAEGNLFCLVCSCVGLSAQIKPVIESSSHFSILVFCNTAATRMLQTMY